MRARYSGKKGPGSGTSRLLRRAAAVSSPHVLRRAGWRAGDGEQAARSWAAGAAAEVVVGEGVSCAWARGVRYAEPETRRLVPSGAGA